MVEIFIIDPHHLTRSGLVSVLSAEEDINVCGDASTSADALEKLEKTQPDLILLDLALLGMSGVEALKSMRRAYPDCKVIVFSANAEDEHLMTALTLGAHAYVMKGSSVALLICALRAVAAGASWMDPVIAKRFIAITVGQYNKEELEVPSAAFNAPKSLNSLSQREREVVVLLSRGMGNKQIALQLCVTPDTVKTHVRHIFDKLDANSRTDAAIKAMRAGLCDATVQMAAC